MTTTDVMAKWPPTVFETEEWLTAWSRSTVEQAQLLDGGGAPMFLLEYSPFWHGYEIDTEMAPIWDRPLVTVGSLYAGYGPAYLGGSRDTIGATTDRARELAAERGASGTLVLNLPTSVAREWEAVRPPDAKIRLDMAYHRRFGVGKDPIVGDVDAHERTEWRRRWRRATERGVRLVEETEPSVERVDEVLAIANGSAVKHGWPVLYDRTTAMEVLTGVPGARLFRADWDGRTVGGFLALEHDRRLYLWAGGMDHTVLRQVSPYLFVLYELLAQGVERGWDRLEFGRGNDAFKLRYGFTASELWSLWYAARPEDVEVYRPRLVTLHERLARMQGA